MKKPNNLKSVLLYALVFVAGWWIGKLWEIVPFLIYMLKEGGLEWRDGKWVWVVKFIME